MNILGVGGLPNDPSAVLIRDGEIAAAVEESKMSRRREARSLPVEAIAACLRVAGMEAQDVDAVALARPVPRAEIPRDLREQFGKARIILVDHHRAHAASAYYASPFEDATVVTFDRMGDLRCGTRWRGSRDEMTLEAESFYPDSLADFYSRITTLLGFTAGSDEHKVQWLSTSGVPHFADQFEKALAEGSSLPELDFKSASAADVASSLQAAVTKAALAMAGGAKNVCLAGGLAFNALLVAAFEERFPTFVQPAAGNSGVALGAALSVLGKHADAGSYCLGPGYGPEEIKQILENCKLSFRYLQTTDHVVSSALDWLGENKIVAWMQGRMEFGPRALGDRSILASPLDPYSTENLNTYIKHREAFRKFAASVPEERASEYFECGPNARHLATVGRVRPEHRERFRAALLGENWIRVHAVRKDDNPLYWRLLDEAGRRTGLPVLYNTSFNLFGEPLVCTPRDAVRSFYSSGIDAMLVGNFALQK